MSVIGLDQLTKAAIVFAIGPGSPRSRIDLAEDGWIALEYAENRGAAFGLFPGLAPALVVVSLAIVTGLLVQHFWASKPSLIATIGIGSIVGGALGNVIDRVRLGYVVDFVSIGPWPNFNLADSAITLGMLALIWGWMHPERAARGPDIG